jgi:hypothetical protein
MDQSSEDAPIQTLPNTRAVARYLMDMGYPIKERTVYKHVEEGKLKPNRQGIFDLKKVLRYARHIKRVGSPDGGPPDEDDGLQQRRLTAEAELREVQVKNAALKNQILSGAYVPRDTFERELGARAMLFRSDAENFRHAVAPEIIALVHGDPALIPDLIEYLRAAHDRWFLRYSEDRELKLTPEQLISAADLFGRTENNTEESEASANEI